MPSRYAAQMQLDFECADEQGACLVVGSDARREELHQRRHIENYIKSNIDSWLRYATNDLGLELQLEDLLFVKGWAKTTHWAVAAFKDQGRSAKLRVSGSFGPIAMAGLGFEVSSSNCSAYHHVGPAGRLHDGGGSNPGEDRGSRTSSGAHSPDQCIFLHYFKMKRRFLLPAKIVAAGERQDGSPSDDPDDAYDLMEAPLSEKVCELSLTRQTTFPDLRCQSYDPVGYVLDYILEVRSLTGPRDHVVYSLEAHPQNSDASEAIASDIDMRLLCKVCCTIYKP